MTLDQVRQLKKVLRREIRQASEGMQGEDVWSDVRYAVQDAMHDVIENSMDKIVRGAMMNIDDETVKLPSRIEDIQDIADIIGQNAANELHDLVADIITSATTTLLHKLSSPPKV